MWSDTLTIVNIKIMIVEYQIGVDVLGFPIYFRHEIYKGETNLSKFQPKPKKWLRVIQSIIKQQ